MALGAPRKSLRYAGVCTLGSVAGGLLGYAIGMFFFQAVGVPLLNLYGGWETYHQIAQGFAAHSVLYIFMAALTPIPYKVFTIAAGACGINLGLLVLASVAGRGLRFFAVGLLFKRWGRHIKGFIDRYFNLLSVLFVVLVVGGVIILKMLWPGVDEVEPLSSPTTEMGQPALAPKE